jgi:hypothetical protein
MHVCLLCAECQWHNVFATESHNAWRMAFRASLIRTMKDTIRSTIHGMPCHRLPRTIVKELASMAARTLNSFPHPDGISDTLSPANIVTGAPKPDYKTLPLEFGTYVQVYDGTSSDTKSRTLGAIATNPKGNSSGDHFFMSLETGLRIHRRSWTVLPFPMPQSHVSRPLPPKKACRLLITMCPSMNMTPTRSPTSPHMIVTTSDPLDDHNLTTDAYTSESESDPDDDDFREREAVTRKAALQSTLRDKRKSLRNKSGCADYTYRFGLPNCPITPHSGSHSGTHF